jgi:tRNA(fMet)-specific endonuclease VapC
VTPATPLFVTSITVSELVYGAHKSARSSHHLEKVDVLLDGLNILSFDESAARQCGALKDSLRRAGTPISEPDLQIASIALFSALPLATHNQRHFAHVPELELVDWM